MEHKGKAKDKRFRQKRCAEYGCPGHIICKYALGDKTPSRFQCTKCHQNILAMTERREINVETAVNFNVGDIVQIGDEIVTIERKDCVLGTMRDGKHGMAYPEITARGSLANQIDYPDVDQCAMVPREKLTRLCRTCGMGEEWWKHD